MKHLKLLIATLAYPVFFFFLLFSLLHLYSYSVFVLHFVGKRNQLKRIDLKQNYNILFSLSEQSFMVLHIRKSSFIHKQHYFNLAIAIIWLVHIPYNKHDIIQIACFLRINLSFVIILR